MSAVIHAAIVQALHEFQCKGAGVEPWPVAETPHRARELTARADAVLAAIAPLLAALAVEHHARGYEERQIEAEQWGGAAPKPRRESDPDYAWPCLQRNDEGKGPLTCQLAGGHPHGHSYAATAGINSKPTEPTGAEA